MSIITPPPDGRPDYSGPLDVTFRTTPIYDNSVEEIPGTITLGPWNVDGYKYLCGNIVSTGSRATYELDWATAADPHRPLGSLIWSTGDSLSLYPHHHVPNAGPYVSLTINTQDNPASPFNVFLYASNLPGASPALYNGGALIVESQSAVSSATFRNDNLYGGPAILTYQADGGATASVTWAGPNYAYETIYDDTPGTGTTSDWGKVWLYLPFGYHEVTVTATTSTTISCNLIGINTGT